MSAFEINLLNELTDVGQGETENGCHPSYHSQRRGITQDNRHYRRSHNMNSSVPDLGISLFRGLHYLPRPIHGSGWKQCFKLISFKSSDALHLNCIHFHVVSTRKSLHQRQRFITDLLNPFQRILKQRSHRNLMNKQKHADRGKARMELCVFTHSHSCDSPCRAQG